jgi:hypothetical protein
MQIQKETGRADRDRIDRRRPTEIVNDRQNRLSQKQVGKSDSMK